MTDIKTPSMVLAQIVLDAQKLREDSYDDAKADEAEAQARRNAPGDDWIIDYAQFYKLSEREAAEQAAANAGHPALGEPVYYMMRYVWNDIQAWAELQLGIRREVNNEAQPKEPV